MNEKQKKVWDYIKVQVEKSNIKRVKWQTIFGMTLTEYITHLKSIYELNAEQTFKHIAEQLKIINLDNDDSLRRVKINVSARFGEQTSYKKRIENPHLIVGCKDDKTMKQNRGCIIKEEKQ